MTQDLDSKKNSTIIDARGPRASIIVVALLEIKVCVISFPCR